MAKRPSPKSKQKPSIDVVDPYGAPIVFFDGAPNFGCNNGVVNVTLATARYLASGADVATDYLAVTHLRCTEASARDLIHALQQALLLGQGASGGPH